MHGVRPVCVIDNTSVLRAAGSKADVSEPGEGWSGGRIVTALDTSLSTVSRTRQLLVEEGFEAVLRRKQSPNSARRRLFDGVRWPPSAGQEPGRN
jgi:hypothetical protein